MRVARNWRTAKMIEWLRNPDLDSVVGDQVTKQKEFDVTTKVYKELEEVRITLKRSAQRARLASIVPSNAFQREIESVADRGWQPRAPLIVILPSTLFAGKSIIPPIV